MWVKIVGALMLGSLALALLSDLYMIYAIHQKAGREMEHAIDAGIVACTKEKFAQEGFLALQVAEIKEVIKQEFYEGMNLNGENNVMKDSKITIQVEYPDRWNSKPLVSTVFTTKMSFTIPWITYPITVKRTIDYESIYK